MVVSGGSRTITDFHACLYNSTGATGDITVRLEDGSGNLIEQGIIANASVPASNNWVHYHFNTPRVLNNGSTYRIVLSAPPGNAFYIHPLQDGISVGLNANIFTDGQFQYTTDGVNWNSVSDVYMHFYFTLGQ
jgi:hypothetical protein